MTRIDMATERDIAGVVAIERLAFSDPWSAKSFRDALDHPAVYFACARGQRDGEAEESDEVDDVDDVDEVMGYVVAWFAADEGEIANLAVAPATWGKGIGRVLLDAAFAEGLRRSIAAMYLEVRDSNARARALYASSGFEEVGRRRNYYRRPVEDAIVLRRDMARTA